MNYSKYTHYSKVIQIIQGYYGQIENVILASIGESQIRLLYRSGFSSNATWSLV